MEWEFEHSVEVRAARERAWAFWSDVDNWARIDPAVEWARLNGPFRTGAHGQTKPVGAPVTDWALTEVVAGERAVIEIVAGDAVVRFTWTLRDREGGGATLTQHVWLSGPDTPEMAEGVRMLEHGIPAGMRALGAAIDAENG